MSTVIRSLDTGGVSWVACLHISGIPTGFISSLGQEFVAGLYKAIAASEYGFGFVATEDGRTIGFIAFATDLRQIYKSVILNHGFKLAVALIPKLFSWQTLRKISETLFYPARIKNMNLPSAELLSIVVAEGQQGKGIAKQLIKEGLRECKRRGIDKVKVLVGAENIPANKLYSKCGFALAGQIENHGVLSNIYVADTTKAGCDVPTT